MLVLTNHLLKSTAFAFNQRSMPTTQSDPPRPPPTQTPFPEQLSSVIHCHCLQYCKSEPPPPETSS